MGDPLEQKTLYTFEEYLELEAVSEERHEFHFGEIFALAGSTKRHNRLARSLGGLLEDQVLSRGCEVYLLDVKLELVKRGKYVYPDVMLTCHPEDTANDEDISIAYPVVLAEVLSDSTESYDRNEKFKRYIKIPSLKYYLLISQYTRQVECYSRQAHDFWHYRSYSEPGAVIDLTDLGCQLELDTLYRGIQLDDPEAE